MGKRIAPQKPINPDHVLQGLKDHRFDLHLMTIHESAIGDNGDEAQRIAETGIKWIKTLLDKNHDYGSTVWDAPVLTPGMDPGAAILVRMSDKIARIQSLLNRPAKVTDESLRDTVADLGAYCLLWLARPEKSQPEESKPDVNRQSA